MHGFVRDGTVTRGTAPPTISVTHCTVGTCPAFADKPAFTRQCLPPGVAGFTVIELPGGGV